MSWQLNRLSPAARRRKRSYVVTQAVILRLAKRAEGPRTYSVEHTLDLIVIPLPKQVLRRLRGSG